MLVKLTECVERLYPKTPLYDCPSGTRGTFTLGLCKEFVTLSSWCGRRNKHYDGSKLTSKIRIPFGIRETTHPKSTTRTAHNTNTMNELQFFSLTTYMKSNNHVVQSRAKLLICPPLLLSQSVKELAFAISVHMTLGALATKASPPITHRKVVWA